MSEIAARAPDGVIGWLHRPTHDFNLQATAEFSWNSRRRTDEEFTAGTRLLRQWCAIVERLRAGGD